MANENPIPLVKGFLACNIDLEMKSLGSMSNVGEAFISWRIEDDLALISYMNEICSKYNIDYQDIKCHEFSWSSCGLNVKSRFCFADKSEEQIRSRMGFLKALNSAFVSEVIPLVDFNSMQGLSRTISRNKNIFFSTWKMKYLDSILEETALKHDGQPSEIITLNPIGSLSQENDSLSSTWFYSSIQILSNVNSSNFCTRLPQSDDPQFPLNIKMIGEEVQGNSGSFRQFLNRITEELQGTILSLLMPYMGNGPFKGLYQLLPAPNTILTEKLLIHLGQILGIAVRSGIPMSLGMMPHFWMILSGDIIPDSYLSTYDPELHRYFEELESIPDEETFATFVQHHPEQLFIYQSLEGEDYELIPDGKNILLDFGNKDKFLRLSKEFRRKELECSEKMNCIIAGIATVLPIGLIRGIFTWEELQLKICGTDDIDINILKKFTMYQVGISDDDRHIQDFWTVVSSLTSKQLKRFIKFACNQERIPKPKDENHVPPPFPMKIAPSDDRDGDQDKLLIRAETCIFMIKIPRYSSIEVMQEKLIYSIQSADDPLSG